MNIEQKIAELKAKIEKEPDNLDAYIDIAEEYHTIGKLTSALKYYEEAEKLVKSNIEKSNRYIPTIYYGIGLVLIDMRRYNEAFPYLLKGLKIAKEINSEDMVNLILIGLAEAFGDLDMFIEKEPIPMFVERIPDEMPPLPLLEDPPYIRFRWNYYEAIRYFEKALELAKLSKNFLGSFVAKVKLGNFYERIGNYSKAMKFLIEAAKDAKSMEVNIIKEEYMSNCFTVEINGKKLFKLCEEEHLEK
jgi:tetratricopeptide (TPR) repeat protein